MSGTDQYLYEGDGPCESCDGNGIIYGFYDIDTICEDCLGACRKVTPFGRAILEMVAESRSNYREVARSQKQYFSDR